MSRPSLERVGWHPPSTFDEYRIEQLIGMGQVGSVFRAHDTLLDRPVAVKFIRALDDDSLTRFLVEARAAARIQHPNVVTLFRVGQLDGRPFLVSELVEGKGLHELPKPVPREVVLEIAIGLARGLAAAHRQGVLHRDIKPGNAILTPSGEVKLLDFGLAKLAGAAERDEHPDARIGTPYFMSPEAWQGREVGPASDLYSVGAVVYELAAGAAPFRAVPIEELPAAVIGRDARPLQESAPAIGPGLAAVVERCLRRDPAGRFRTAEEMLEALLRLRPPASGGLPLPEGNPYRGLQPFEAEHRGFFFGRSRDVSSVLARLRSEPAILVTGDSGAGKSSLCLAGVLPRIAQEGLGEAGPWRVVRLVPGRKPLAALAMALAPALGMDETAVEESLRISPDLVLRKLRPGGGEGIVIFVDQLEELVTLAEPAEAELAAELLSALVGRGPGVRLVTCARSDFLARIAALRQLGERLGRAIYLLRPLGPEDVREAIVGPARVRGGRFEPELVDALVAATGDGGLPLLQFALAELWEARERVSGTIARESLDRIGGVAGALARHGDDVLEAMLPDQREAARRILSRLVTPQGTRARCAETGLATDASSRAALEALVRGRLLVAREADAGGPQFELAHEALLHGWTTLSRWMAEDAGLRELRQRLSFAVAEWERAGRPEDGLWPARKLAEAAALDRTSLVPAEVEFLRVSGRAASRRRWALRLAIPAAVAIALGFAAAGEMRAAAVHAAKLTAARAVAHAERHAIEGDLARWREAKRAAFDAFDAADRATGERRWPEALEIASGLESAFAHAGDRFEALALLGGAGDAAGFLEEWAEFEEEEGRLPVRDVLVQRMRAQDPDGAATKLWDAPASLAVSADAPGTSVELFRYEIRGKRLLAVPEVTADAPFERSVTPGSYLAVFSAPGRVAVRLPFVARRGTPVRLAPRLPAPAQVPPGFAYVPEGAFLFGSGADEGLREYYKTAPLHPRTTPAFLIAREETTLGDWIQFLEALPPEEAARRTPAVSATGFHGLLRLEREHGAWALTLQPEARAYHALAGQRIHFDDRASRADQDWLRFPVTGIAFDDAKAYAAWLDSTGRVPGARLCDEVEWERAARGADDRDYPSGYALEPDDANFDQTYGKAPLAFGPDEVGSHPGSRSPFEVDDLAGNAWEWTRSSLVPGEAVARGGSYYFSSSTLRVENRELPEPTLRDPTVGMRVCASVEPSRGTP